MANKFKKIYFVGIKGVGMTPLAIMSKQARIEVAGSDINQPFITDSSLNKEKITVFIGFNPENIENFIGKNKKDEILIISTAAHGGFDNPETKFARENGFNVMTQGQALGYFMKGEIFGRKDIEGISVAGSHGKTTISSMLATFLTELKLDPSFVLGTGEIFPLGNPGHYGKGKYFIAESDEYVSELNYDKVPKFLHQFPKIAIFNNIDFDHPDFFKDINEVEDAFYKFTQNIQKNGILLLNGDDSRLLHIKKRIDSNHLKIVTYGANQQSDFYITRFHQSGYNTFFRVESKGLMFSEFKLSIPGYHNAKNALSIIALLLELGIPVQKIKEILPKFMGSKRRSEIIGKTSSGALIIDDYAHHPQEIKTTLKSLKESFPEKKIICIFQPHTYSRTKALLSDFIASFYESSELILMPTFSSMRTGEDEDSVESEFIEAFKNINKNFKFFKNSDFVVEYVINNYNSDKYLIVTMGAGDVYKIASSLKASSV